MTTTTVDAITTTVAQSLGTFNSCDALTFGTPGTEGDCSRSCLVNACTGRWLRHTAGRVAPPVRPSRANGLLTPIEVRGNHPVDHLLVPDFGETLPAQAPRRRGRVMQHQLLARRRSAAIDPARFHGWTSPMRQQLGRANPGPTRLTGLFEANAPVARPSSRSLLETE